jgi:RNA polymerase sigma-70 factor (ECF subfamily)
LLFLRFNTPKNKRGANIIMDNISDLHLFQKIKSGDKSALEYCYKKYFKGLYYYSKGIVNDSSVSNDIVQECFLKIWENKESIIIQTSLSSYLYKMVYNYSLNHLKHQLIVEKQKNIQKIQLNYATVFSSITNENGQSILIAKEFSKRIDDAIENLPEKCKQIFKLSRYEGLKNTEIAEKLNVSLNTVQKQISIALSKLRKQLSDIL